MKKKRLAALLSAAALTMSMIAANCATAQEASLGKVEEMQVSSSILLETGTNQVLYENKANDLLPIGSLTKLMTILLTLEDLEAGKIQLTDMVTCSDHANSMGGPQIWLKSGETMSVEDLLKTIIMTSANDAAVALAEYVGGSEPAFVDRMNQRAQELGMKNTAYATANGIDGSEDRSTAYDTALLMAQVSRHELYQQYATVWMDSLRGGETELVNTNKLVRSYDGILGGKTAVTKEAKNCMAAAARRSDFTLVAVVLGCETEDDRAANAKTLLDYGFASFEAYIPQVDAQQLRPVKVVKGVRGEVPVAVANTSTLVVPKGSKDSVEARYVVVDEVLAPVKQGQSVGKYQVVLTNAQDGGEEKIFESDIITTQAVGKMNFWHAFRTLIACLFQL